MEIVNMNQGSAEWHAHRATHFNASDAPAMMGCSPYKSRAQLLHEMHTGLSPEVDAATQRRFDDGHRAEALARPLAEQIIGEDLAPIVGASGKYSASFDGITMLGDVAWEHKTLGQRLRNAMHERCTGADLPWDYMIQMEHQCMVCPTIQRVLFMASKFDDEGQLVEQRHCWYTPAPELRQRLIAGWDQFAADLASYVPPAVEAPKPIGRTPEHLPALRIEVTGHVTASNLSEFKEHALAVFAGINRNLTTDQEFADAEQAVKWCADVEGRLAAAKQHALSQTASIDELFRTMDEISAEARRVRLELDRLVKAEKEARRSEIVTSGMTTLKQHIGALNERIGSPYMPAIAADFAGSIKGKKSLDSMRAAVNDKLARAKIEANEVADRITLNLRALDEHADHASLFQDVAALVLKQPDDLAAFIKARIADHQAREQARREAEQQAQQAIQQAAAPVAPRARHDTDPRFAVDNEPPTLKLGAINERLFPIALTEAGIRALGIEPAGHDRRAVLYRESDFPRVFRALIAHIERLL